MTVKTIRPHLPWYKMSKELQRPIACLVSVVIDKLLAPVVLLFLLTKLLQSDEQRKIQLDEFLAISIIVVPLVLLLASRRPSAARLGPRTLGGMALTYLAPIIVPPAATGRIPRLTLLACGACGLFYLTFLVVSFLSLGRNAGILPSLKGVTTSGPYKMVRHPIYASTIYLFGLYLIALPSLRTLLAALLMTCGLFLRASEEEALLDDLDLYQELRSKVPRRFFDPVLIGPLALCLAISLFEHLARTPH